MTDRADRLTATFSALADPTRRAILARLSAGEATVGELAEPFDISLPAISRHLKVLEGAGLITRSREAQWRPCRLEPQALQAIDGWLASPGHRSTLLSDRFTEFGLAAARVGEGRDSRYGIYWAFIAGGGYEAWL